MDRSDYLFTRPSFIKGVSKILSINGYNPQYNDSKSSVEDDLKALKSEWLVVGKYMKGALDEYRRTKAK